MDYFGTYSHLTWITTIRMLIALVASCKLAVHHMDVKTCFLNSELKDEVYMEQLEDFVILVNKREFVNHLGLSIV